MAINGRRRLMSPAAPLALLALLLCLAAAPSPARADPSNIAAVYFPETGHHLRLGFLDYWRRNQGPERLGFPLTEESWDGASGGVVQYFERGRLEWLPESAAGAREAPAALDEARGRGLALELRRVPPEPDTPDWSAALAPPAAIVIAPSSARQGQTVVIRLEVDDPAAPVAAIGGLGPPGEAPGAALAFAPGYDGRLVAFGGVAMNERAAGLAITPVIRNALGLETRALVAGIEVVDAGFPEQRLALPGPLVPLLEHSVRELEALTVASVLAASAAEPHWRGPFLVPVRGTVLTTHGARRTYVDLAGREIARSQHPGIDIAAPLGVPLVAPANGVVAFTGTWSLRGNVVVLDHGARVHSVYAHLASIAVEAGQQVTRGELLGRVGSTGLSVGPHLHWEVWAGGVVVDPLEWTRSDGPWSATIGQ